MKVILITDVPKVGNKYEVKELKSGFAQNVLIARGLAILATPEALSQLKNKKNNISEKKNKEIDNLSDLIKKLTGKKIVIKVKCNEKGHLFKSVNSKDIIFAIKKSTGFLVNESNLTFDHIKELGKHLITLKKGGIEGKFEIEVIAI